MNVEKVERLRPPRSFREAAARGREARMPTDTRDAQPSGISGELAAPTPPAGEAPEILLAKIAELEDRLANAGQYQAGYSNGVLASRTAAAEVSLRMVDRAVAAADAHDLPWRRGDIERGLILFRTSSNAHGSTNVSILSEKVGALPQSAKDEMAGMMRNIAIGLSAPAKESR